MTLAVRGVARRPGPALEFIAGIARRSHVLVAAPDEVDAWILLDPSHEDVNGADRPVAVWWSEPRPAVRLPACVRIVVSPVAPRAAPPPGVLPFPYPGLEVQTRMHVTPTLRQRWRRALHLPDRLTADLWSHTAATVSEEDRVLVLVASAVAARGSLAAEALATGAPLVTDAATARSLGLRGDEAAVVVDSVAQSAVLDRLASELRDAAMMSRRARRFAETHLDQGTAADLALHALLPLDRASPISSDLEPAVSELARQVSELGLPPRSDLLDSLADRLIVFSEGAARR
jgi:hypothetical protein